MPLLVTLPDHVAALIEARIAAGEAETPESLIEAVLREGEPPDDDVLDAEWSAIEQACDAFEADPQKATPADVVFAALRARLAAASTRAG